MIIINVESNKGLFYREVYLETRYLIVINSIDWDKLDPKRQFDITLWKYLLAMEIGLVDLKDFEKFLDNETLNDNDSDIILDLQFSLSKGINNQTQQLKWYIFAMDFYKHDEYQYLVEDLVLEIIINKYKNKEIKLEKVGYYAYKLCLYYHPYSELIAADDYYDIDRTLYMNYVKYIERRVNYSRNKRKIHNRLLHLEKLHLSKEFRTDVQKMKGLLHKDFIEVGKNGTKYTKVDILNAIPLDVFTYDIENFNYVIADSVATCTYDLIINNTEKRSCISKWAPGETSAYLIYFESKITW